MAKTTDRQIVNGETYFIADTEARERIAQVGQDIERVEQAANERMGVDETILKFNINSENLFDRRNCTFGEYINQNGTRVSLPYAFQTGVVPVEAGKKYATTDYGFFVLWFNNQREIIGASESTDVYATAPENAAYGKFMGRRINFGTFEIREVESESAFSDVVPKMLIHAEETNFMEPVNLFDKSAGNMIGERINSDGETIETDVRFSMTDFIRVTPGNAYEYNDVGLYVLWYNSNKEFIGYTSGDIIHSFDEVTNFTAPDNAAYVRLCFSTGKLNSLYLHDLTDESGFKINKARAAFFEEKNLFEINEKTLVGRYYSSQDGTTVVVNSSYGQSDLIPVAQGEKYTSRETGFFVNWYNYWNVFLGSTSSVDFNRDKYVTAPSGAVYARFMFTVSEMNNFYVSNLDRKEYKIDPELLGQSGTSNGYLTECFKGKKWTSFGDSITFRNTWQPTIARELQMTHTNKGIGSTALCGPNVNGREDLPSFWKDIRINAVIESNPDLITILGGANDVTHSNLTIGDAAEFTKAMPTNAEASEAAEEYSTESSYAVGDYCKKDSAPYECTTAIEGGETWNAAHWKAVKNVDTFLGAYSYIVEKFLTWKRTVSIVILGTTWAENDATGRAHGVTYTDLSEASRQVAQYYGLPFVDLHGLAGFNKYTMGTGENAVYSEDQIHPNEEGSKQMIKLVMGVFINEVMIH